MGIQGDIDMGDIMMIIMIFISVILGLSLTNTISDIGHGIETHNNSSAILVLIAPYIGVIWFMGCMALAGVLSFVLYRKHKK